MLLPVLQGAQSIEPQDLARLFNRSELHLARALGDEAQLEVGVAFTSQALGQAGDANQLLDGAMPPAMLPEEAVAVVEAHFASAGTRCAAWTMNPSAPPARTTPLLAHLAAMGWIASSTDILYLASAPIGLVRQSPGLSIIPARASLRHSRALAEVAAAERGEPQGAEAWLALLDDPRWDALLALRGDQAVAGAGVLAGGEVGRVDHLYVAPAFRRQGIGRVMMSRILEICARSLFKHVMLACRPETVPAQALHHQLGFLKIGQVVTYRAPWTRAG